VGSLIINVSKISLVSSSITNLKETSGVVASAGRNSNGAELKELILLLFFGKLVELYSFGRCLSVSKVTTLLLQRIALLYNFLITSTQI
jgi:hypothetical protein